MTATFSPGSQTWSNSTPGLRSSVTWEPRFRRTTPSSCRYDPDQQTWDIEPVLGWCWPNVVDGRPTSTQHRINGLDVLLTTNEVVILLWGIYNQIPYAHQAVSSSPRPSIGVFALPETFNMAVTRSDLDPNVLKMPITFYSLCRLWAQHASM